MSGHETIRVLEVGVDASLPSSAPDGRSELKAEEGVAQSTENAEASRSQNSPPVPPSSGEAGKSWMTRCCN